MRKPRKPNEPKKPTPPEKVINIVIPVVYPGDSFTIASLPDKVYDAVEDYRRNYGYKIVSTLSSDLKFVLSDTEAECYDCYTYSGTYATEVSVEVAVENPHYEKLAKKYKKDMDRWGQRMADYVKRLAQYEKDIKIWETEQIPKIKAKKEKEKKRLEKEIAKLKKELDKI